MKNNEILLSVWFQNDSSKLSFLFNKEIKLSAMLDALSCGFEKQACQEKDNKEQSNEKRERFEYFDAYRKKNDQLLFLYRAKDESNTVSMKEDGDTELYKLGIVTGSCLYIGEDKDIKPEKMFPKYDMPTLCDTQKMEYNISTRRITVPEKLVINILPPGAIPGGSKRSYADVIIPTIISLLALCMGRVLLALFRDDATGFSMLAMVMITSVSTMVVQSYNYVKQGKDGKKARDEWKKSYMDYLTQIWKKIELWQKQDIAYLRKMYPQTPELFQNTERLDKSIFSRSRNDFDFMKIGLGTSDKVLPLFEIANEKKDEIFSEAKYEINTMFNGTGNAIRIVLPENEERGNVTKGKKSFLSDLPYELANNTFKYLKAEEKNELPPLLLDIKQCGALGVVDVKNVTASKKSDYAHHLIEHIIFNLAYYHAPEDLQFVIFFDSEPDERERENAVRNYKNLPHMNELFEDASQFVFDDESAGIAFSRLQSIMSERSVELSGEDKEDQPPEYTQIVCIIFDDYNLKETGFSKYLPEAPAEGEEYVNQNGLTFIVVSENIEQLPRYCGNIIEIAKSNGEKNEYKGIISNRHNIISRDEKNSEQDNDTTWKKVNCIEELIEYKDFYNDHVFYDENDNVKKAYEDAFRRLSAIYYRRIEENGNVPSKVDLFEMYEKMFTPERVSARQEIIDQIKKNWKENDVTEGLAVPIGKNEHGIVSLDLYEKADGPHMLVAGTTGAGKSETILTYLIGLCIKYSPTDLNLLLIDMKGGGFSDLLRTMPHCVGAVDDMLGESDGISSVYMLKRFLDVLNAEIKRRKGLLKDYGVNTVDDYIKVEKKIAKALAGNATEEEEKTLSKKQISLLEELRQTGKTTTPLSHLILVVDEFTELKRFSNESGDIDYITEITTIARVGRTLGFHIVLASQNIEGAITDDIRVNCKSRICLKVATRAASKEMLDGRADAASPTMPLNGRAYHLVGTGSKYVYFQSAYTGADVNRKMQENITVAQVKPCGKHDTDFYVSSKQNEKKNSETEHSKKNTQLAYVVDIIEEIRKQNESQNDFQNVYRCPKEIFKAPLSREEKKDLTEWR